MALISDRTPAAGSPSRYFDPVETASKADIRGMQLERLLSQLAWVCERSPLVRKIWAEAGVRAADIRSLSNFFAKAPFTDKDMLRDFRAKSGDPYCGVLCVEESRVDLIGTSSGTTGDPTVFGESWTAPGDYLFSPRELWELGLRPGDYLAHVDHVQRSVGRLYFHDAGVIPILFDHDASDLERFVEWCLKYEPTWMFHLSSPLTYGLAKLEAETGVDLRAVFSKFEAVIWTGEPMGREARAHVEKWGAPVYEMTSVGDSGTAWECRERTGYHVWEDLTLLEVLDPAGEPVPSGGRGEMVVTNLIDRTDPLIRFRSGDLVQWVDEACSCGRTHARIWPLGRIGDEVVVNGRSVMPSDISPAVEAIPETAAGLFQIIRPQRDVSSLRLRVGYDNGGDLDDLIARLAASVEAAIGIRPEVELTPNGEILKLGPAHKIPRSAKS